MISTHINGNFAGDHTSIDKVPDGKEVTPIQKPDEFINAFWNGSEWLEVIEEPIVLVPNIARSMNFRLVLIQNGISLQSIYGIIADLPFPENELAYQMFEYATHYDRNNAMINKLAERMNVSQEQLDSFFVQSENLIV